ncbi:MAG: dependent oxidoreductase [Ferruginibacter sp.]|nr:dependent oxidoreductase [Ferruginibacter sp.]
MQQMSIWEKETFFEPQDVIIIGSGFSGLWSALHLKLLHPNYKVTILERGLIPTGASTKNAGFSCFGSPSEILNDARLMGKDDMWQLVRMRFEGIKEIRNYFSDEEIEYDDSGGYECFTDNSEDWHGCLSKLNWLNEGLKKITGKDNVFTVADKKLRQFGFHGFDHLVENKLEGGLHPGKLIKALLKKIQALNVQVFTGVEVMNYVKNGNYLSVITNHDIEFTAKKMLLCTNAFTQRLIPSIDITPNRGQVLLTSPIDDLPLKGIFHFDKGFYYFRNLGNRILLGGARNMAFNEENTLTIHTTELIQDALEQFIQQRLSTAPFTITDRWAGIMAMGSEKLPIVKAISENVFCCVRMSGMGVALAPVAAKKVVQLMSESFTA